MSRHGAGERKRVQVLGVHRRCVTYVSPRTGRKSQFERYRISSILFDKPARATVILKAHDPKTRYPK